MNKFGLICEVWLNLLELGIDNRMINLPVCVERLVTFVPSVRPGRFK